MERQEVEMWDHLGGWTLGCDCPKCESYTITRAEDKEFECKECGEKLRQGKVNNI